MTTGEQERELIALVEGYRQRTCTEFITQAHNTRKELIHNTYREARERLHQAVERERSRANLRLRTAIAELHTKRRAVEQRYAQALLQASWNLLADGLRKRWLNMEGRRAWIYRCALTAIQNLPATEWTVKHPLDCDSASLDYLQAQIAKESSAITLILQATGDIEAGLIIISGDTHLDISLQGLLRDKKAVEARILALMNGGPEK